jgi:transcriptional regulator with XRE-family HTH domain
MKKNNIYLSSNIKYLRMLNGKTQQDLAKFCEKANTAVSNWEKGIREPDAINLAKIAEYFGVQIDDLMLKDLRFKNNELNNSSNTPPAFRHEEKDTGFAVEIIPTKDIDWKSLTKEEKEQYINQAMDALYEAKKEIKNDK